MPHALVALFLFGAATFAATPEQSENPALAALTQATDSLRALDQIPIANAKERSAKQSAVTVAIAAAVGSAIGAMVVKQDRAKGAAIGAAVGGVAGLLVDLMKQKQSSASPKVTP